MWPPQTTAARNAPAARVVTFLIIRTKNCL